MDAFLTVIGKTQDEARRSPGIKAFILASTRIMVENGQPQNET
jgi:hypothetical protein